MTAASFIHDNSVANREPLRILLVSKERSSYVALINRLASRYLNNHMPHIQTCNISTRAIIFAEEESFDLIVYDGTLPDLCALSYFKFVSNLKPKNCDQTLLVYMPNIVNM